MGVHQIHSDKDTVIIPTLQIRKLRWEWRSSLLRITRLVSGKARIEIQADCPCKTPLEHSPSPPSQPKATHSTAKTPKGGPHSPGGPETTAVVHGPGTNSHPIIRLIGRLCKYYSPAAFS